MYNIVVTKSPYTTDAIRNVMGGYREITFRDETVYTFIWQTLAKDRLTVMYELKKIGLDHRHVIDIIPYDGLVFRY